VCTKIRVVWQIRVSYFKITVIVKYWRVYKLRGSTCEGLNEVNDYEVINVFEMSLS